MPDGLTVILINYPSYVKIILVMVIVFLVIKSMGEVLSWLKW